MKKLKREDFKKHDGGYYVYEFSNLQICLELCLNGFDVGIYRCSEEMKLSSKKGFYTNMHQLEKKCLDEEGYENDWPGVLDRTPKTWRYALKEANRLFIKYI